MGLEREIVMVGYLTRQQGVLESRCVPCACTRCDGQQQVAASASPGRILVEHKDAPVVCASCGRPDGNGGDEWLQLPTGSSKKDPWSCRLTAVNVAILLVRLHHHQHAPTTGWEFRRPERQALALENEPAIAVPCPVLPRACRRFCCNTVNIGTDTLSSLPTRIQLVSMSTPPSIYRLCPRDFID